MFAEFHRDDTRQPVLVNPSGVLLVWDRTETTPVEIVLATGDRVRVQEHYGHVSARLQEALQARPEVAA